MDPNPYDATTTKPSRLVWRRASKPVLFIAIVIAIAATYSQFGDVLTLDRLAEQEQTLRAYQRTNPTLVAAVGFLIYVVVTGLSLPGAAVLTLVFAWYFGLWQAFILVSFASTLGATIAFLMSRYLFRNLIQRKFGERLESFNKRLEEEGAFYLFTLRLIPAVPFFVLNLVMGLTPITTRTFWWVSQVGMLAGTFVYVYAGASVPSLAVLAEQGAAGILTPKLLVAFAALGLFPIVAKKTIQYFRVASV